MSTHTPGPWVVEVYADISEAMEACGFKWTSGEWDAARLGRPASVWQSHGTCYTGLPGSIETTEANARLIAAAPDLLAACEEAATALENVLNDEFAIDANLFRGPMIPRNIARLRAAIAKAKGGGT